MRKLVDDLSSNAKLNELSAKIDSLILACKISSWILLLFVSLIGVGQFFTIKKFQQLYADALPGKPLPLLTEWIISAPFLVVCLACLWPVLGFIAVLVPKRISTTALIMVGLLILAFLQIIMIGIALYMPMVSLVTGMSESPSN